MHLRHCLPVDGKGAVESYDLVQGVTNSVDLEAATPCFGFCLVEGVADQVQRLVGVGVVELGEGARFRQAIAEGIGRLRLTLARLPPVLGCNGCDLVDALLEAQCRGIDEAPGAVAREGLQDSFEIGGVLGQRVLTQLPSVDWLLAARHAARALECRGHASGYGVGVPGQRPPGSEQCHWVAGRTGVSRCRDGFGRCRDGGPSVRRGLAGPRLRLAIGGRRLRCIGRRRRRDLVGGGVRPRLLVGRRDHRPWVGHQAGKILDPLE